MKLQYKTPKLLIYILGLLLMVTSCKKGLDYTNDNNISPDNVWNDPNMIKAFLSDIYGRSMPGWSFNGNATDEGISTAKSLGEYQRGILTVSNTNSSVSYANIDRINFFLDQLKDVPTTVLPVELNKQYTAEAKFWRAWAYWSMVKTIGGVPLILQTQKIENVLNLPRNKTSECVTQIVKDLDSAALLLPGVYTNATVDYGRITKTAALAFKGRILLTYASPLFNPTNNSARWQAAYDANKAAVDYAISQNYGLHPTFSTIWTQERNSEVIMVNQFAYPSHPTNFNGIRPEPLTKDASNNNQPLLSLLLAFPKKDGSPMQFDRTQLSNTTYNAQFLNDFYTNRDDRFYTTVFCGGTPYPTPDELSPIYVKGNSFWNVWQWDAVNNRYINALAVIHPGMPGNPGITGFFQRKGLDITVTAGLGGQAQTDWVEIRYAEVLMNYGECANELGKTTEAIQVLKDIRKRAGILAGIGNYGVTAVALPEIREAYIAERQVEFAFENKRFDDLRRLKRYDILNSQGARHGLYITLNPGEMVTPADNIMTASVRSKFTANFIDNLDGDENFKFNLDLNHWFYALNPSNISQSKDVLKQNKEWGGTFDPLE